MTRTRQRISCSAASRGSVRRQRGVAFVLVLWVIAMLAILLGSFSLVARTEGLQSRHLFDTTQARYAAEAGLNLAAFELRKTDPTQRWVGDGRPYRFGYGDAEIEIRITDDSGKIDLNSNNGDDILRNLFLSRGVPEERAEALTAAIHDWKDADDETQPNGAEIGEYKAAGLSYGPKNAPFDTVSELQQVLGMDYTLFSLVEPSLTIYSGSGTLNQGCASADTLRAQFPDVPPEELQAFVEKRQATAPGDQSGALQGPNGQPAMACSGGLTYSVKSRATMPNGASTTLDSTIRMGGVSTAGRPFVILRWRDGEAS